MQTSLLPRTLTGAGCSTTGCGRSRQLTARRVLCNAAPDGGRNASSTAKQKSKGSGLGDVLGPIGLTLGSSAPEREVCGLFAARLSTACMGVLLLYIFT